MLNVSRLIVSVPTNGLDNQSTVEFQCADAILISSGIISNGKEAEVTCKASLIFDPTGTICKQGCLKPYQECVANYKQIISQGYYDTQYGYRTYFVAPQNTPCNYTTNPNACERCVTYANFKDKASSRLIITAIYTTPLNILVYVFLLFLLIKSISTNNFKRRIQLIVTYGCAFVVFLHSLILLLAVLFGGVTGFLVVLLPILIIDFLIFYPILKSFGHQPLQGKRVLIALCILQIVLNLVFVAVTIAISIFLVHTLG